MASPLDKRSIELRLLVLRAVESARRGHLGSAFSLIEIMRVLYDSVLNYKAHDPSWHGRDRILRRHGCLAQYAILADKGFFPRELNCSAHQMDPVVIQNTARFPVLRPRLKFRARVVHWRRVCAQR